MAAQSQSEPTLEAGEAAPRSLFRLTNDEQDFVPEQQRVADADGLICGDDLRSTILERQLVGTRHRLRRFHPDMKANPTWRYAGQVFPWLLFALIAVPLVVIAFAVTRRRTLAGEHPPSEDAESKALTEQEFAEAEAYQAKWREQDEERYHQERFP